MRTKPAARGRSELPSVPTLVPWFAFEITHKTSISKHCLKHFLPSDIQALISEELVVSSNLSAATIASTHIGYFPVAIKRFPKGISDRSD